MALGVALALVVAELGLRGYHAASGTYELDADALRARRSSIWTRSDDPELAYVHRPSHQGVGHAATEANGLLHPADVATAKPDGVLRIALVGDSVGAGLDLPYEQRFGTLLESVLRDVGMQVEVLNFCVNGYSTVQEARVVETRLDHFDVDVVVLQYCMNDPVVTHTPMAWFVDSEPPACFVVDSVRRGARALFGAPSELPYVPANVFETPEFWEQHYAPDSESWQSVCHGFDRIATWSETNAVPVLVAVVPLVIPQDPTGATSQAFREQAATAARARGLQCIDLQGAFTERSREPLQMTPGDVYHPNATGHAVIARSLMAPLLDILEGPR